MYVLGFLPKGNSIKEQVKLFCFQSSPGLTTIHPVSCLCSYPLGPAQNCLVSLFYSLQRCLFLTPTNLSHHITKSSLRSVCVLVAIIVCPYGQMVMLPLCLRRFSVIQFIRTHPVNAAAMRCISLCQADFCFLLCLLHSHASVRKVK